MEMPTFNKNMESENLAVKIFTDTCCESCTCQSDVDHITAEKIKNK